MSIEAYVNKELENLGRYFEENELQDIVDSVKDKFDSECDYFLGGGFDSPGYEMQGYVLVFLNEEGTLVGKTVVSELS